MATNLKLPRENLYSNSFILEYTSEIDLLKRDKITYSGNNPNDQVHQIVEEEKIWNIAAKYYGDSKWWWVLCDVNEIDNPFDLPIGDLLIIPDLPSIISQI